MSPTAFVAFASELLAGAPASAMGKDQASADDVVFADVLMDAEGVDVEQPEPTALTASPEKTDRPLWPWAIRSLPAEELAPPVAETQEEPALDEAIPVFITVASEAPTPRPEIVLPDFAPAAIKPEAPVAETHEMVAPVPVEATGPGAFAAIAEPTPAKPTLSEAPVKAPVEAPTHDESEAAPVERPEAAPVPVEKLPAPQAPTPEVKPETLDAIRGTAPPPVAEDTRSPQVRESDAPVARKDQPAPVVFNALITPEPTAKEVAAVEPAAPETAAKPITTASKASEQTQTGSGDADANKSEPPPQVEATPQRHTALENATPVQEAMRTERSGATTPARETTEAPRTAPIELKEPATPGAPLKRVEVRIPNEHSDVVVQMQERNGSMQVTVRTGDARAASEIAGNLPELTRNLGQQGFQTETWTPDAARDITRRESSSIELNFEAAAADALRPQRTTEPSANMESDRDDTHRDREPEHQPGGQRRKKQEQEDFEEYLW